MENSTYNDPLRQPTLKIQVRITPENGSQVEAENVFPLEEEILGGTWNFRFPCYTSLRNSDRDISVFKALPCESLFLGSQTPNTSSEDCRILEDC